MNCHKMDEVMKDALVMSAFANTTYWGNSYEEQINNIKTNWEALFDSIRKYSLFSLFNRMCEQLELDYKIYNFDRHHLFLNEWREEIEQKLCEKISFFFCD